MPRIKLAAELFSWRLNSTSSVVRGFLLSLVVLGVVFIELLAAQGRSPDQAFAHALQLQQSGDLEGSAREYREVLAANPERFDARSNLGAVLSQLGRYEEAIGEYKEALRTAPPQAANHLRLNLALAYYKSLQIAPATEELKRVHAAEPANITATLLLADCHLRVGEFKSVIELLAPVEQSQPENRAITYLLGMALLRDGQVAAGQQRVEKILHEGDSAESRFLLASAMFMAHDYPGAVKSFARAIELNPELPSLQSFYGRALLMTGDATGAAAAFHKELVHNPNDYDANLGLGEILEQRRSTAAAAFLKRAAQLRPTAVRNVVAAGVEGGVAVGSTAPEFPALGTKPVVLIFGSYTCPQFRGASAALNELADKYASRMRFLLVYVKEAHGSSAWESTINEREGVVMPPPRNLAEKQEHADVCSRKLNLRFPVVVDGMNGEIEAAFGAWPSRVYVVGGDGHVAFNSGLGELDFHPDRLEDAIRKTLKQ
jgi:tetratricopeptide (TPR) repeat protein